MKAPAGWLWPLQRPAAWVPLLLGATSISSLLLYFFGVASLGDATRWVLIPGLALLAAFVVWSRARGDGESIDRVAAGLWAGAIATLAYDLVRVPISVSGTPVFKAISYFGTVMIGVSRPTLVSEVLGWLYHLSNGMGFGLMYAMAMTRRRLWTALAWGVALEAVMLSTPYAEVLGYRASPGFVAVSLGAHLVYGAALWAALERWRRTTARPGRRRERLALAALAVVGVGLVGADSGRRHAASIPPSPPAYIGRHLYTTWNVPEPDRVALLWVIERFVDPAARFHFIEPFSAIDHGTPVDLPEAEARRSGTRSATELELERLGLAADPALATLGRMTHLFEIARWRLPAHPAEHELGLRLIEAVGDCEADGVERCIRRGRSFLDDWYAQERKQGPRQGRSDLPPRS